MRKLDLVSPLVSVVCMVAFVVVGVYAVQGAPHREKPAAMRLDRPDWLDRMVGSGTFPAYFLRADSASVPIGRAVIGTDRVTLSVFPDKWEEFGGDVRVHIMPTDIKALWATVPKASKLEIATRVESLARSVQTRVVSMVGSPHFGRRYQERFRAIGTDAYQRVWRDPRFQLIQSSLDGLYRPEDGERLAGVLMPIVLPELRRAIIDTLTPHWDNVRKLLMEGRIDPEPFREAAGRVLQNVKLQEAVADMLTRTASNPRVWRVAALLADIFVDKLTGDPRFEALVADLMRDPVFEADMRHIEVEVTVFTTSVFDMIVQRGDANVPDTLAMRMLRYILLNRLSAVAILVDRSDPQAEAIIHYAVGRSAS